jgi:hypothetical protein
MRFTGPRTEQLGSTIALARLLARQERATRRARCSLKSAAGLPGLRDRRPERRQVAARPTERVAASAAGRIELSSRRSRISVRLIQKTDTGIETAARLANRERESITQNRLGVLRRTPGGYLEGFRRAQTPSPPSSPWPVDSVQRNSARLRLFGGLAAPRRSLQVELPAVRGRFLCWRVRRFHAFATREPRNGALLVVTEGSYCIICIKPAGVEYLATLSYSLGTSLLNIV